MELRTRSFREFADAGVAEASVPSELKVIVPVAIGLVEGLMFAPLPS